MSRKKRKIHNPKKTRVTDRISISSQESSPSKERQEGLLKTTQEDADSASVTEAVEAVNGINPYDETLLDVCRTRWQLADWDRLAAIDAFRLMHHPQRAKLALLIAAAHWQLGETHQAQRLMQQALDWGASERQIAQMLVSGVHHSLAVAQISLQNYETARLHCQQALRTSGVAGDIDLLASVRLQRMQENVQ